MLHDLYLLSCYFQPTEAVLYEDDLKRRYGVEVVTDAIRQGLVELYCAPCSKGPGKFFCRLSQHGLGQIEAIAA